VKRPAREAGVGALGKRRTRIGSPEAIREEQRKGVSNAFFHARKLTGLIFRNKRINTYFQVVEDMDHLRAYSLDYVKMELWNALDAAFSSDLYERNEVHPSDWLLLYRISIAFAEVAYSIIENCPTFAGTGLVTARNP